MTSTVDELLRKVRAVLLATPDSPSLYDLLVLVDDLVAEYSSLLQPQDSLIQFEEQLQQVHDDVVDHSSLFHTEVLLAVLHHLGPVLSPTSIISWFDIVIRPALREPKLPTPVVNYAKELVISALSKNEEKYLKKVNGFRRRVLELYLLDAYNEGSSDDALEFAELNEEEKEKRTQWKSSLEDILIKFGMEKQADLMTELDTHFDVPSSRLQLLILLNTFISTGPFDILSPTLASHPLMLSIIRSLLLDNSSTVCIASLSLLVKLLPTFAVHSRQDLRSMFPSYLAILARVLCWKEAMSAGTVEGSYSQSKPKLDVEPAAVLPIAPDIKWNRLELTSDALPPSLPSARSYFTILYYLYPSNVLQFLSDPAGYLAQSSLPNPYALEWGQAFDQDEIRRRSERLVLEHVCHPLLLWRDAAKELSSDEFWFRYSLARIISEASMLDVRRTAVGVLEQSVVPGRFDPKGDHYARDSSFIRPIDLSLEKPKISLEDMVNTTLALKSSLQVDIVKPASQWPHAIFSSPQILEEHFVGRSSYSGEVPFHIVQVISALQREIILLRNELNFELWLSRENVKHIGRLYQDRIQAKAAENERQGLYNKLRNYRQQVIALEKELSEHKEQASSAKNKYADWNRELQKKLKEFREEKRTWISEAASLRKAEKEAQDLFQAQGKLLADALKQVFELQTQRKETQHKIDRLKDYEHQISQHLKIQRMWDDDFSKFNQRGEEITLMRNQYHQMKLRLESYEKTQEEMEDAARAYRRRIQTLEARLTQTQLMNQKAQHQHHTAIQIDALVSEKVALVEANSRMRNENIELKDELEELRAMIEILKGEIGGRQGLIMVPRANPIQSS